MSHPEHPHRLESIKDRIFDIEARIGRAAERSRRSRDDIQLVAVSKTVPVDVVNEAISAGLTDIGESKIQELMAKKDQLKPCVKHLIGSLQTNKARKAIEIFDVIQSVDRPRLAETLDRISFDLGQKTQCLIEVKVSNEASKQGCPIETASEFIRGFKKYQNLDLRGLMTIAPFNVSENETRTIFKNFKTFFDANHLHLGPKPILSMGMTDDFEMAIEEGSTMVRIGRAIFGERVYGVPRTEV